MPQGAPTACRQAAPLDRSDPIHSGSSRLNEEIPARLFTDQELAQLNRIRSDIECECPRHLSEIVATIAAFEAYSEHCENKNEDDAALHAHLHLASAKARAIMEEALDRLVEAENIHL